MRTTLNIDCDVLLAAKVRAKRERKCVGEIISELARQGLNVSPRSLAGAEPEALYGFRPFPGGDAVVTNEMIDQLRDSGRY